MSSAEIREVGDSAGLPVDPHERIGMLKPSDTVPDPPGAASVELKIPGYEFLGRIHDGAMGTVFKARQISVDRIVAIKVLGATWARDADHVERFCRESLIAAQLLHPNIVATIDAGVASGRPYLVMEYVRGLTLHELLEERGTCDEERTLPDRTGHCGSTYNFLHQHGLTHRDIKPAHFILTAEGVVKLFDVGLARPSRGRDVGGGGGEVAVGTPDYMSPGADEGAERPGHSERSLQSWCHVVSPRHGTRPLWRQVRRRGRCTDTRALRIPLPAPGVAQRRGSPAAWGAPSCGS